MVISKTYDGIVIGSGQSGVPLAVNLARAGWEMALIESDKVGGTCVNYGCTPTKTMIAGARVAYLTRRSGEYGVNVGSIEIDMKVVRKRKDKIVKSFRSGSERNIENTKNLELIRGEAGFVGKKEIEIKLEEKGTKRITGNKIFINTGTRNFAPPIEGLNDSNFLDSTSIMELDQVPGHLIVIGGGYIGLEFGQMFRRYGSKVTIIQNYNYLLSREDNDVSDEICKILREDGIDIVFNAAIGNVKGTSGDKVTLDVATRDSKMTVEGTHLLVSTGRKANVDSLQLENAGIETDERGFIVVNDKLDTNVDGIYAIGDVNGGPAFTHISYDDFRILKANLLEKGNATTTGRMVPYTVFIDPQLGRVGLSEKEAKENNIEYRTAKLPMAHVARALEMDETRGFMKVLVDPKTDKIIGCAILGVEGGEIMSAVQMAMMGNVPYTKIREGVFAHPTLAESLNNLFMAMDR